MHSQEFIKKYSKKLFSSADFFNVDTSMMPRERYDTAKCRFLLIFPTPHYQKAVSATASAINDFVIEHCPDVFIDFAYMPESSDVSLYDANNMPYAIGNITHLDPSHFDIIGFSISILTDNIAACVQQASFQRCDIPIPTFWSQRKDLPLGQHPLVMTGGITAAVGDVMYGEDGNGNESFIDVCTLGDCGKLDIVFKRWIEAKTTGKVTRSQADHDVPGMLHYVLPNFEEVCEVKTTQDFIDSLFDIRNIYQPQAYKVKYDEHRRIISNHKINPKAQDWVQPYYPHIMADDLGVGRTIINGNGDAAGNAQTQISEGCSASGQCSFCSEGAYTGGWVEKTKERILWEVRETKKYNAGYSYKPYSFNGNYITDYKGMLIEFRKIFPKVQFINMRMEELGRDVDAIKMMKLVGANKIAAPIEGVSPRIQNNMLNKCLSTESLRNFMEDMVHAKMTDIKCLTADAITPSSRGLLRQSDFEDTENVYGYEPTTLKFLGTKLAKVYSVETVRGTVIKCTGDHLVLVNPFAPEKEESYKRVDALTLQDKVYSVIGSNMYGAYQTLQVPYVHAKKKHPSSISVTEDFAEWLGWVIGDGSIECGKKKRVRSIYNSFELCVRNEHEKVLQELGIDYTLDTDRDGDSTIYSLIVCWADFVRVIYKHCGHRFDGKKIPAFILQSPKSVQAAFLRGLFGADGTICDVDKGYGPTTQVQLGMTNKQLLQDVQTILMNMGIVAHLQTVYTKSQTQQEKHPTWILHVLKPMVPLFMQEIGFSGVKNEHTLTENCFVTNKQAMSRVLKIKNSFLESSVKSITCVGVEEVYIVSTQNHSILSNGIISHNCGSIFTMYEEDEDWQWLYDFVMEMKAKAGQEGGKFPIRINATPLIHYPLTALEYLERKSAKRSYEHIHWLSDYWYDKYFEANMRVKVHGFSYSTFIEQSLVDLGRALTPFIYKHFVKNLTPIMSLRNVATDEFLEDLRNFIDPEYHFADRDPEHYISPCHRIHIEMMGSYVTRARRLLRYKRNGKIFDNPPDIRCLKTYEGAQVKCMKDSLKDDPLRIYNDVDLVDGNLIGEYRDLIGCERCQNKEERIWRLTRPMPETANSDTVRAQPALRKAQKVRFILNRLGDYDILNPNNTAHTFLCQFLQLSDHLLDTYHSVEAHSHQWHSDPGYHYFFSGTQVVDTYWQEDVIKEIRNLIPQVNERLKTVQVVAAFDILNDEKIKVNDEAVYYFETSIDRELFLSAERSYKGTIKVEGQERGTFEIIEDPNLCPPVVATKSGKTCGIFHLPVKYNPSFYMSGLISTVKKMGSDPVNEQFDFQCITVARQSSATCKHCSEEKAISSLVNNKPIPMGFNCYCKALLTALIK